MFRRFIFAIASTVLTTTVAQAARLTEVEGTVLVNRGDGFWEVNGTTTVSAGDRILVRGKGRARIDFGAGCMKKVSAQQTFVVSSKPICDAPTAIASSRPSIPTRPPLTLRDIPSVAPAIAVAPAKTISEQHLAIIGMLVTGGTVALANAGNDTRYLSNAGTGDGEPGRPISDMASASAAEMPSDSVSRDAGSQNLARASAAAAAMPSDASSAGMASAASRSEMPSDASSRGSGSQHLALASAAAGTVPSDPESDDAGKSKKQLAQTTRPDGAAMPSGSGTEGTGRQNLAVVNNLVVARTEFAEIALEGGDNTDGTPASP